MTSTTERERQSRHVWANREELAERIERVLPRDGTAEPHPGLFFSRFSKPTGPVLGVVDPSFCVIAQGSKDILLGDERFRYDPAHYLISTVGVPAVGQVVKHRGSSRTSASGWPSTPRSSRRSWWTRASSSRVATAA